jgi:hypothetical protein
VLRTSRFFPEPDDSPAKRNAFVDANLKANEFLYRRADVQDIVDAHLLAIERAPQIGFGRYILSATTPFTRDDLAELRAHAPAVVSRRVPGYEAEYARRGWRVFPGIERVYDNTLARQELGWRPTYDFAHVLDRLRADEDPRSPLAQVDREQGVSRRGVFGRPVSGRELAGRASGWRAPASVASTKLTVLAATPVVAALAGLLLVVGFLAGDAQAHARQRLAPRLGDGGVAFFAMGQPRPLRQLTAGALDRVRDGGVDLVLYGAVACPTCSHDGLRCH